MVPLVRELQPQQAYVSFLSLARDRLGLAWSPQKSLPSRWSKLLRRLELLKRIHPEVHLTVLPFLDGGCNVE